MEKRSYLYFFALLLGIGLLTGCSEEREEQLDLQGAAQVNIFLVDAPADFDEVWVEVLAVELRPRQNGPEEDERAWIRFPYENEAEGMLNLLTLTGGRSEQLASLEVPAGDLAQIRLILGDNNFLMRGGQRIPLTTPSAQQSGLKLNLNMPLSPGGTYDLVLDFDVDRSIVRAGNSGMFILRPVLHVVVEALAQVEGRVLPAEAGPLPVRLIQQQDTLSTFTNAEGFFRLGGLRAGTYRLEAVPNAPFIPFQVESIRLDEGERKILEPFVLEVEDN
ncbi:MAG: DUF4382 domain-containing protein [Nitritalea sp.]